MNKMTYVLQDWAIVRRPAFDPYRAPEDHSYYLTGKCYGNPRFADGTQIDTSNIVKTIDDETFETANSIVKVGKKDANYQLYLDQYNSQV